MRESKKHGLLNRIFHMAVGLVFGRGEAPESAERKREEPRMGEPPRKMTRSPQPAPTADAPREQRPRRPQRTEIEASAEPAGTEAGPVVERFGAARDNVSFEQQRRGGPVTGGVHAAKGPRHGGGGKTRGRMDEEDQELVSELPGLEEDLPLIEYDELPANEILKRIPGLRTRDVEILLQYETRTKHRQVLVDALRKRLSTGRRAA